MGNTHRIMPGVLGMVSQPFKSMLNAAGIVSQCYENLPMAKLPL